MRESLRRLIEEGILFGEIQPEKVSNLPPEWFVTRQVDFLDFRGDLQLRSQRITLGRHVKFITASHIINTGEAGAMSLKRVWVEGATFIGSYSILYNCHIKEGVVISVGSVVSNMVVEPYTIDRKS